MLNQLSVDHFLSDLTVDPDQLLFHYTTRETLGAILQTGNVRLSNLDNMNDPREKKEWVPRRLVLPVGDITQEALAAQNEIHAEPDRLLRQSARIACFTRDRQLLPDADPASLFHRGWARARMWHQYASEHTGACVVFDQATLAESLDSARPLGDGGVYSISPVKYVDRPLDIPLEGAFATTTEIKAALDGLTDKGRNIADLFFTKNTDWKSEDEVRALVLLWDNGAAGANSHLDLPYGKSLRAVVLGENFGSPEWLEGAMQQRGLTADNVLRADWVNGMPTLKPFKPTRKRIT